MKAITLICIVSFLVSCAHKLQEIEYGIDLCEFCSMGIVDKSHAAQLVTVKGKNYKFDSIECMIHFMQKNVDHSYLYLLVADYNNPGELISIRSASFIISKNVPSPMNAYLSAVGSKNEAHEFIKKNTGDTYTWNELIELYKGL